MIAIFLRAARKRRTIAKTLHSLVKQENSEISINVGSDVTVKTCFGSRFSGTSSFVGR